MALYDLDGVKVETAGEGKCWVAPNAVLLGKVKIEEDASVWDPDRELVVTLETRDGGAAFDLLRRLPERAVARLVLRDLPGRRARKLGGLGRLRREIERLGPREVDMPTRWKNLLAAVPKE